MTSFSNITLGGLTQKLADEFGYNASDSGFIRDKIREAYASILESREVWPWLISSLVFNTELAVTGTVSVVNGSKSVGFPTSVGSNRIVQFSGDTTYYITMDSSGLLDTPYVGSSGTVSFTAFRFGYAMPVNYKMFLEFVRQDSFTTIFTYRPPSFFFNRMRVDRSIRMPQIAYTVTKDRTGNTSNFMMYFDPIFNESRVIRGSYVKEYAAMDSLDDKPDIPGNDKLALYYEAAFRIAGGTRREANIIAYYAKLRDEHLDSLKSRYDYAGSYYSEDYPHAAYDIGDWNPSVSRDLSF